MKRFINIAAIMASLSLASLTVAADASAERQQSSRAQRASLGGGTSPASLALTVGLVITGAAVIALGAWSGDSAETP